MQIKNLKGKKVAVWGLGTEGVSVAKYLIEKGITNNIILLNDIDSPKPKGLESLELFCAEEIEKAIENVEVIVRSPGVSIYRKELQNDCVEVTSICDLFINEIRSNKPNCKIIGVTGSKGKSMSVSAMAYMLNALGCKTGLGGNIGKSLLELLDEDYEYIVAEFSSYQASDLTASPHLAMFTNLFFVHTDWHSGHENYCKDKVHLIANQKAGDAYFINAQNQQLVEYTNAYPEYRHFSNSSESFYAEGKDFCFKGKKLFSMSDLKISGNHNLDNFAGVFAILDFLGLDIAKAAEALKNFVGLPHRLQRVAEKNNVLFINDSISTAPEAAIGAINSFDGNLVLISGGFDNEQDYTDYAKTVEANPKVKMLVSLFQTGPKIAQAMRENVKREGFVLKEVDSLQKAVEEAYEFLQNLGGGVVLLSPTSPSFGFYKNFVERGEHFISLVDAL